MKIALDISPISGNSDHTVRGVGSYIRLLQDGLVKYDSTNSYIFFSHKSHIPKDADIIHYPYFDPFHFFLPRKNLSKSVVTIHDLTPILYSKYFPVGIKGRFFWNLQKMMLPRLGGIITDSASSARDIGRLTRVNKEKIFPIHLAADESFGKIHDTKAVSEVNNKYSLPRKFALYVGDVTWNKNLPFIIRSSIGAGVPLILVGRSITSHSFDRKNAWNNDLILVQRLISENTQNIKALGYVPDGDLAIIYNLARVLVMPSLYEGFGLPVLEAMRSGCPVITSKNGSLPEVGGDAVVYVDSENEDEMIKALKEIFADDEIYDTLRKKGLLQAENFTIGKTIRATIKAYEASAKK